MIRNNSTTYRLRCMLESDPALRQMMLCSLQQAAEHNPDIKTNPVRTLDDLYRFLDIFITSMPWQAVEKFSGIGTNEPSLFRRIDQSIGYFYFLFDQPLAELQDKGYVYPSLQYEPRIAQWILEYNSMWGLFLSYERSWTSEYLQAVSAEPMFGLQKGWYESADNWHSWNDFFARRLASAAVRPIADSPLVSPCDGEMMPWVQIDEKGMIEDKAGLQVKNSTIFDIDGLLRSEYAEHFYGGIMTHIVLDMHNYHHFHGPVDGTIVEINHIIEYSACSGGHIIWDEVQHRYRYEQKGCLDYQLHEPRKVYIIRTDDDNYVALVAVAVAQVGKIEQAEDIHLGSRVSRSTDLGHFLCGSDVLVLLSKNSKFSKTSKISKISKTSKISIPILMGHSLL